MLRAFFESPKIVFTHSLVEIKVLANLLLMHFMVCALRDVHETNTKGRVEEEETKEVKFR